MNNIEQYQSALQANIKVWHRTKSTEQILQEFGLPFDNYIDRKDSLRHETYCNMVLLEKKTRNISASLREGADFLELKRAHLTNILIEGEIWLIIKLFDCNYLDIIFDRELIARFESLSVGISFENHAP